jgi:hypothetical protein
MTATYSVLNCAQPASAAPVKQTTLAVVHTMMQLAPLAGGYPLKIVEWNCSFDGDAAATPGQVELFACTGAATMTTAYGTGDIMPYGSWLDTPANTSGTSGAPLSLGTALSGFATTSVTEGTVANYRSFDSQLLAPTAPYFKQFPLGREPQVGGNSVTQEFLRVRVTFGTAVNMQIGIVFEV